jgi:ComF family protein
VRWSIAPVVRVLADAVCPERCGACDALVAADELLCGRCRRDVHYLLPPGCERCGLPLPAAGLCAACIGRSTSIRAARAWAAYRGASPTGAVARTIAAFKYRGAQRLGRRLAAAVAPRVPDPTVALVVPVPLHPRRLRARGFNQSAVVARHLARRLGRPTAPTLLVRTRDTPSQTTLDVSARTQNVAGAFAVRRPDLVAGRTVLVVDDVWTSGATARSVAEVLRDAGAAAVDVVTIARVL